MEQEIRELMEALKRTYKWRFTDEEMQETPKRFVRMLEEWDRKHQYAKFTRFEPIEYNGMVVLGPIHFDAFCSHHLQIFDGHAWIGYIPGKDKVYGASKPARIVEKWAYQAQTQERLTKEILDDLETDNAIVVIKAKHFCMIARGIEDEGEVMTTSSMKGEFFKAEVRAEFLTLAGLK
jgi:GTP cyclohydrolase IA